MSVSQCPLYLIREDLRAYQQEITRRVPDSTLDVDRLQPEDRTRIEAKDALKSRLGRSPDRADAVVMAFAESGRRFMHGW